MSFPQAHFLSLSRKSFPGLRQTCIWCSNAAVRLRQSQRTPCQDITCQVFSPLFTLPILHGHARLPFTTRASWLAIQSECKDLRRTHAHLVQGTRPSKKFTNVKDVKQYLNVATIAKHGLLGVKRDKSFPHSRKFIIVPTQVLDGLLPALHIQLSHPLNHQLKMVTKRYLSALDMDKAIERVVRSCTSCAP